MLHQIRCCQRQRKRLPDAHKFLRSFKHALNTNAFENTVPIIKYPAKVESEEENKLFSDLTIVTRVSHMRKEVVNFKTREFRILSSREYLDSSSECLSCSKASLCRFESCCTSISANLALEAFSSWSQYFSR